MLYTLLRSTLLTSCLAVVTTLMASAAAFAGATTSVNISGKVLSTLSITVLSSNQNIDLSPNLRDNKVKVADLQFGTNNSAGLYVTASGSSFILINTTTDASVSFLAAINDETANSGVTPSAYSNSKATSLFSTSKATSINSPYSLYIRYSTLLFLDPGDYKATIHLTVADK